MGSYLFANQYQNEVVPADDKRFKKEWIRYYRDIPKLTYRFGFVDPAIGQKDHHDFTGIVIIDVDSDGTWYVRLANRYRLSPTEIVAKMFEIQSTYKLNAIGVEIVAYQEALLYLIHEESKRKQQVLPVKDIRRSNVSKETRILGLVPRFEWGRIYLAQGQVDLENELASFPRAAHDDLLDALSSLEEMVFYPTKPEVKHGEPNPNQPGYEKYFIGQLAKGRRPGQSND